MYDFITTQLLIFASIGIAVLSLVWRRRKQKTQEFYCMPNVPKDTVILHQFGPGLTVPSVSPFVIKLETYLKVAKIPYEPKFSRKLGPKGKVPWIQYNEHVIPDSQFCIEFLNKERQIDLNKKLSPNQHAVGHMIRKMVEESLYWSLLIWRCVLDKSCTLFRKLGVSGATILFLRQKAKIGVWAQGIGRHSQEEVTQIMEDDLRAVSQILGNHKFLFGDNVDDVTEYDCALFGQLCQVIWHLPGCPIEDMVASKYPNLVSYCERMRDAFWPDWNDRLLQKPGAHPNPDPNPHSQSTEAVKLDEKNSESIKSSCNGNQISSSQLNRNVGHVDIGPKIYLAPHSENGHSPMKKDDFDTARTIKAS